MGLKFDKRQTDIARKAKISSEMSVSPTFQTSFHDMVDWSDEVLPTRTRSVHTNTLCELNMKYECSSD